MHHIRASNAPYFRTVDASPHASFHITGEDALILARNSLKDHGDALNASVHHSDHLSRLAAQVPAHRQAVNQMMTCV